MLTTRRIGAPVCPVQVPDRTASANAAMRSSTACTAGTTSSPSTSTDAERGARRAVCSTARCSETLIASPRNIAAIRPSSPDSRASWISSRTVSSVIRFLE